jgi:hypothetical protein
MSAASLACRNGRKLGDGWRGWGARAGLGVGGAVHIAPIAKTSLVDDTAERGDRVAAGGYRASAVGMHVNVRTVVSAASSGVSTAERARGERSGTMLLESVTPMNRAVHDELYPPVQTGW